MKKELTVVTKQEVLGKDFTVYGTVEEPLFLAKDVAEWIEHSNLTAMVNSVDADEKIISRTKDSLGRDNSATFLTENGLYEVLMLSRKPIAKQFKSVVKKILKDLRLGKTVIADKPIEPEVKPYAARVECAKLFHELADTYRDSLDDKYSRILDAYATKQIEDEFILPLPEMKAKTYSAGEIGKLTGLSANKVGHIANLLNLKNETYGEWVWDKKKYGTGEVQTFRYYENVIPVIKQNIKSPEYEV